MANGNTIPEKLERLRAAGGSIDSPLFNEAGVTVTRHEAIVERYVKRSKYGAGGRFARPSTRYLVHVDGKFATSEHRRGPALRHAKRLAEKRNS